MFAMLQLSSHITKNQKHFLLTPQIPPRYGVSPKNKKATPGWPGIAAGLSHDGGVGGERGGDRGQHRPRDALAYEAGHLPLVGEWAHREAGRALRKTH